MKIHALFTSNLAYLYHLGRFLLRLTNTAGTALKMWKKWADGGCRSKLRLNRSASKYGA